MRIEKAKLTDDAIIADIGRRTFFETHPNACDPADLEIYLNDSFALPRVQSELADSRNIFHLVYVGVELAGYSKIIPNYKSVKFHRENVTRLERIYVLQKYFDQKIGSRFFDFLVDESKKRGQVGMLLGVWVENHRAIEFYKRKGFEIFGETIFRLSPTRANPNHLMYLSFENEDYSPEASAWVNLLVPGRFDEAEKRIAEDCSYAYQAKTLVGSGIINAFVESHQSALRQLDSIEYLPGKSISSGADGVLVAVSDRISLNGQSYVYNDRLRVKMKKVDSEWFVIELEHLPIAEERDRLKAFLESAGPKRK